MVQCRGAGHKVKEQLSTGFIGIERGDSGRQGVTHVCKQRAGELWWNGHTPRRKAAVKTQAAWQEGPVAEPWSFMHHGLSWAMVYQEPWFIVCNGLSQE